MAAAALDEGRAEATLRCLAATSGAGKDEA